jgi:hypothetical protein
MRLDGEGFEIFFYYKNQNYRILLSNCILCAQKCSISTQNKLDFVPRGPRGTSDEEFWGIHIFVPRGMRNENLMRTPGNGDPGVPIANPRHMYKDY